MICKNRAARSGSPEALLNYAAVELLNWEDHVPVLSPHDISMLDGELLEVLWLDISIVLGVRMSQDEWLEIHSLGRTVAKGNAKLHIPDVLSPYDV